MLNTTHSQIACCSTLPAGRSPLGAAHQTVVLLSMQGRSTGKTRRPNTEHRAGYHTESFEKQARHRGSSASALPRPPLAAAPRVMYFSRRTKEQPRRQPPTQFRYLLRCPQCTTPQSRRPRPRCPWRMAQDHHRRPPLPSAAAYPSPPPPDYPVKFKWSCACPSSSGVPSIPRPLCNATPLKVHQNTTKNTSGGMAFGDTLERYAVLMFLLFFVARAPMSCSPPSSIISVRAARMGWAEWYSTHPLRRPRTYADTLGPHNRLRRVGGLFVLFVFLSFFLF